MLCYIIEKKKIEEYNIMFQEFPMYTGQGYTYIYKDITYRFNIRKISLESRF